jgi:hypothetical protein
MSFIAGVTVNWRQAAQAEIEGILTDYPLELQATLRQSASSQ